MAGENRITAFVLGQFSGTIPNNLAITPVISF